MGYRLSIEAWMDISSALRHIVVRGIERRKIVDDGQERLPGLAIGFILCSYQKDRR